MPNCGGTNELAEQISTKIKKQIELAENVKLDQKAPVQFKYN